MEPGLRCAPAGTSTKTLSSKATRSTTTYPLAILKGYLLLGLGLMLYNLLIRLSKPQYAMVLLGLFFLTFPILIHKSLRFFAHHSVYRNIPFRFTGGVGKSYKTYLLFPLLIPLTLGLIAPY
jgi:uncharacterized membrane protein YjgN (DUF898 family)